MLKNHKLNCQCCICKAIRKETVGENNNFYGKKHSEKTKQKNRAAHLGKHHTEKTKQKNRAAHLGKHHTEKTKQKIGKCSQNWWNNATLEQKIKRNKKVSEARKGINLTGKHLENLSIAHKGKHSSPATEFKKGQYALEKHFNWQGGKSFSPYTLEFNQKLKLEIRQRDNFTCQLCGVKENGKAFMPHHIDYNKQNCNEENLILLCRSCNSKANYDRNKWELCFVVLNETRRL